jgi:preprotein translocase subunit SecG
MYIIITVLIIIVSILLSVVVLIQNPKGGGVSATFSGASQQLFGASRSSDVVEKTTWTLAVLMMVFCLSTAFFIKSQSGITAKPEVQKSEVEKRLNETGGFNQPIAPVQPQQQQQQQPASPAPAQ